MALIRASALCLLILATPALSSAAPGALSETSVTVVEDAQPVRDVLRRLEEQHGLNYVFSEEVLNKAGTVTVRLKQVPLDVALESICAACGLSLEIRGPVLVILPRGTQPRVAEVRRGLLPRGANHAPRQAIPQRAPAQPERVAAPPAGLGSPPLTEVGKVIRVDLQNGLLQVEANGAKRDFYLPDPVGDETRTLQVARLRGALASLRPGYRVALVYQREGSRSLITDLVGGSLNSGSARQRPTKRSPRPRPVEPQTAPETLDKEGVLVGRYLGKQGDAVRVRRGDGKVFDCFLPDAKQANSRAKVSSVIEKLKKDERIYLTYKMVDEKLVIKGTLVEVKKQ